MLPWFLGKSGDAKIHPRTREVQDKCHQMSVVLACWLRLLFTFCRIQHENEKGFALDDQAKTGSDFHQAKATTTAENGSSWIVANLIPQMTGLLRMRTKK